MALIHKPTNQPLSATGNMVVPARLVPSFRVVYADERGARNNILLRLHGGLGDIVCAEPAVRYALETFKGVDISLATKYPELFQHLNFKRVFDLTNAHECVPDDYLMFENIDTTNELAAEFVCHTLMHGVDYASVYMWRIVLPNAAKEVILTPSKQDYADADDTVNPDTDVVIHPGKTWDSRTFPKKFWDKVIKTINASGLRCVIIGGVVDDGRASTVDVNVSGCLDLRGKTSLMQTTAILHRLRVLLTNDSSPLHIGATGDIWIGFVSTVKYPDHLFHWRKGVFGWRMQDFGRGGMYKTLDACPNKTKSIHVDKVDTIELLKWLPDPVDFAKFAINKLNKE